MPAPGDRNGATGRGLTVTRPDLIVDGSDAEFRHLVYALLTVSIRFDRLREQIGRVMGLSGLQYHILMVIEELSGERDVNVGAVAEALHVSSAYITMETAKLVRLGTLVKRPNPRDRRGVLLSLTARGRRAVRLSEPWLREINDVLFASLDREDFQHFRRIMEGMVDGSAQALAIAERVMADGDEGNTV
jgi:DNA-binding MarR family transcriptional regulator